MACKARNLATKVKMRLRAAGMDDEVFEMIRRGYVYLYSYL
jgi:hypothetical protein